MTGCSIEIQVKDYSDAFTVSPKMEPSLCRTANLIIMFISLLQFKHAVCTTLMLKLEKVELIVIYTLRGIKSYTIQFMFCDLLHLQCSQRRHVNVFICELKIQAENLPSAWCRVSSSVKWKKGTWGSVLGDAHMVKVWRINISTKHFISYWNTRFHDITIFTHFVCVCWCFTECLISGLICLNYC